MQIYGHQVQSKFIEPKQVFLGIAETIDSFIFFFILGKGFCYLFIYLFIYLLCSIFCKNLWQKA